MRHLIQIPWYDYIIYCVLFIYIGLCVIDLDTVMPGYYISDIGNYVWIALYGDLSAVYDTLYHVIHMTW